MAATKRLVEESLRYYERKDKARFDQARQFYRGDHWGGKGPSGKGAADFRTAYNLIFGVAETAVVNMVGQKPSTEFQPRNMAAYERGYLASAWMDWAFDETKIRRRSALAILDAVLCDRGIFKTGWDFENDVPLVRVPDPATVFFDPEVRDQDDSTYWLHATAVHVSDYEKRVADNMYPRLTGIRPKVYPKWIGDSQRQGDLASLRNLDKYYEIWEHYDLRRGKVRHFLRDPGIVLFEDDIEVNPFTMFFLNHTGVDIRGLSETSLLTGYQRKINDMLSLATYVAYRTIPQTFYDARKIKGEDLNGALNQAEPASFVPLKTIGAADNGRIGNHFHPVPMPERPNFPLELVGILEQFAGKTSALASASRGVPENIRTAQEVSFLQAHEKTRLAYREMNFHEGLEDVAKKMFWFGSRYMRQPKFVRIAGAYPEQMGVEEVLQRLPAVGLTHGAHDAVLAAFQAKQRAMYRPVRLDDLQGIEADFRIVAYNGLRANPMVRMEAMQNIMGPLADLANSGAIDASKINLTGIVEELFRGLDFPPHLFGPNVGTQPAAPPAAAPPPAAPPGPQPGPVPAPLPFPAQ